MGLMKLGAHTGEVGRECVRKREDGDNECWQILGLVHKLSYNCARDGHWPATLHYVRVHCSGLKPLSLAASYSPEAGWLDPRDTSSRRKCFPAWSTRSFGVFASRYEIVYRFQHSPCSGRVLSPGLDLVQFYVLENLFKKKYLVASQQL